MNKIIKYNYYHWGPFLYKTILEEDELKKIQKLCSKKSKDHRENLAGLIKHEYKVDSTKLYPIIHPYLNSYLEAYKNYSLRNIQGKIKLAVAWVNYMTKFEANPSHIHDGDLSFVIYTKIPKNLKKEIENSVGKVGPGTVNFQYTLGLEKYNINQHTLVPEVGDFYIFPSSLHHIVNHFQSDGERISVAGNVKIIDG